MEERIRWYPRRSGPRTGARWPRVASGRPVSPSHSPARSAPKREVPPLRSGAPRHAPVAPVRRTRDARQGGPLIGLDPDAPRAQQPVHGCSDGDVGGAVGDLVVGAGPWARIAPGVDHGEGTPPKARARRPLDGPGAHRVGDLRGSFPRSGPHRSWTPGGGGYRAPSCPRRTS